MSLGEVARYSVSREAKRELLRTIIRLVAPVVLRIACLDV